MAHKSSTEDLIMETLLDNEFLLFPEKAAKIDTASLEAIEKSYNYDMSKNSDILGELSFREYLDKVNPQLLEQRSDSSEALVNNYIGPVSDGLNGVSKIAAPLKNAVKQFKNSYPKMITSAIRAFDTMDNFNAEEEIAKTNNKLKDNMLQE